MNWNFNIGYLIHIHFWVCVFFSFSAVVEDKVKENCMGAAVLKKNLPIFLTSSVTYLNRDGSTQGSALCARDVRKYTCFEPFCLLKAMVVFFS